MSADALKKPTKANYPDLDIMKLVMALFVVEIHTHPFNDFPQIAHVADGIVRLAVPFFFVASAFLCFRGLGELSFAEASLSGAERVRKTIGKLLRLYLTWTVIFLPVTVFGSLLNGGGLLHAVAAFVRGTLLIGQNYYSWPLWYLLASVVGFALVYIMLRGGVRLKWIILSSLAFLLIGYCITIAQDWATAPVAIAYPVKVYCLLFGSSRNGLFEGCFYVAVGAVLGMNWDRLREIPLWAELVMVVGGLVGNIFISNDAHLPFCAIASIGLFLLSVRRCGTELKPHVNSRKASTIIYLVHMFFVVFFVYGVCGGTNADLFSNDVSWPLLFAFSLGGSVLVSVIVIPLSGKMPTLKRIFGI